MPKTAKNLNNCFSTSNWSQKPHKNFLLPKLKKILKIKLSIRVRNFVALNETLI